MSFEDLVAKERAQLESDRTRHSELTARRDAALYRQIIEFRDSFREAQALLQRKNVPTVPIAR